MASLSHQLDRLSVCTTSIKEAAQNVAGPSASLPFTSAVLQTHLGDLIRDVDSSELSLFTLVAPHPGQERVSVGTTAPELSRVAFHGATPLKRPPGRRDDDGKMRDVDPEVYLQAALKYIHRYQSVRPMRRVFSQAIELLDQIEQTRRNIEEISQAIQRTQVSEGLSLRPEIQEEEQHVHDLEQKVREAKAKIHALHARKPKPPAYKPKAPPPKRPVTPVTASDPAEESFWTTPTALMNNDLNLSRNLLNEEVDVGDISTTSFASPIRPQSQYNVPFVSPGQMSPPTSPIVRETVENISLPAPPSAPSPQLPNIQDDPDVTPQVIASVAVSETPATKARLRINAEVERIVAKIWATMGDIIMPGHPFQTAGEGDSLRPPRAKETISHLMSVAALTPPPSSPSDSDMSSLSGPPDQPTLQQILTAHLLVSLLSSPPNFSLPLNKAKDVLTSKAIAQGGSVAAVGQGATRIVYNCVAKRLVKIDRGRGEQTVKFNM